MFRKLIRDVSIASPKSMTNQVGFLDNSQAVNAATAGTIATSSFITQSSNSSLHEKIYNCSQDAGICGSIKNYDAIISRDFVSCVALLIINKTTSEFCFVHYGPSLMDSAISAIEFIKKTSGEKYGFIISGPLACSSRIYAATSLCSEVMCSSVTRYEFLNPDKPTQWWTFRFNCRSGKIDCYQSYNGPQFYNVKDEGNKLQSFSTFDSLIQDVSKVFGR